MPILGNYSCWLEIRTSLTVEFLSARLLPCEKLVVYRSGCLRLLLAVAIGDRKRCRRGFSINWGLSVCPLWCYIWATVICLISGSIPSASCSVCRSQPLGCWRGAEEKRRPGPSRSGSRIEAVTKHCDSPHQEVPQQPEAQTVSAAGGAGGAVCRGQTGTLAAHIRHHLFDPETALSLSRLLSSTPGLSVQRRSHERLSKHLFTDHSLHNLVLDVL